ncbi:MAG: response regulator [Myxococcota bacterium]
MPGVNGTEICARLRKGNTKDYVYVILLSSQGEKEDLIEGMAAGADDYIIKPFDPEELNARLRAAKRILDLQLELSAANGNLEARVAARTVEVEQLLTQKNQFVNQLGHDLKTPLTPLVALLPRLAKRTSDERSLKLLSLMMDNVAYMRNLVERTLTLAHLNQVSEDVDLADVDIQPPIVSTLMTVREEAESQGITLNDRIEESVWVRADPLCLRELLHNIVSNAIKYSNRGDTITIDAKSEMVDVNHRGALRGRLIESGALQPTHPRKRCPSSADGARVVCEVETKKQETRSPEPLSPTPYRTERHTSRTRRVVLRARDAAGRSAKLRDEESPDVQPRSSDRSRVFGSAHLHPR